jgi:hypothetical protein
MALRAWNIEYSDLYEVKSYREGDEGAVPLLSPVGDAVQDMVDDIEGFLAHVYGNEDPDEKPTRQQQEQKRRDGRTRAPKNTWKHKCPKAKKLVHTKKGEICAECGAEE